MPIYLFASEIGSLLGLNDFINVQDAIDTVVARIRPDCASKEFLRKKRKADNVKDQQLPHTISACDQWKQEKLKTARQIEQVCIHSVTAVVPETRPQELVDQLSSLLPTHVVERCVEELDHTRTLLLPLTSVKPYVQHMLEEVAIAIPTATTVSTRMVTDMHKIAVSNVHKARGIEAEERLVQRDTIKSNNTTTFKKILFPGCMLIGKVDGLSEDGWPMETKNRQKRLFRKLWPSERVQIDAYMFLTAQQKAIFIETYADERYEEVVEFDSHAWNKTVRGLQSVVLRINRLLAPTHP